MTLLCIGDIHIKPTNTHLVDSLQTQLVDIILREHVTHVVLLGDILDTFEKLHTQALNRAYELIHALRSQAHVYVLVGNHDLINNQQFLSTQHWMNALKDWTNVTVVDRVRRETQLGLTLVCVPYVPVQRFREALDTVEDWSSADYIFAHQEFMGSKMGAIQSTHGDPWSTDAPMVISGHIHDYQRPQDNVLYIGASIQNNFGDQTDPRILCIRGPQRQWKEIPLSLPKKKTVYSTLDDVKNLQPEQWIQDASIDTVRIVVRGDYEQFKTFLKSAQYETLSAHQKCKIVHKPETSAPASAPTPLARSLDLETSFQDLLVRRILERRREGLFVTFRQVAFGDETMRVEDILIV